MISKPLIQKYIHVCHPDNWNTHNHQATESPQNTQTHTVHWNAQNSQPIETPKLPRQLIHPNRPAQGSTQTAQFTEIPWSDPLQHATHLVHWNTLLLHRPLGFYSMKQTISTIYPPPPPNRKKQQQQHMQKKHHKHWMGFNGALKLVPNPPPSRLLFFLFCYATSKIFWMAFRWQADGCPTLVAGWDRVCPCLVPSSSSVALIRFLRFCKILVRKMQQNIPCDA